MKKYYADIDLEFDEVKHGIVGEMKRQEMVKLVEEFAHKLKLDCNTRNRTFINDKGQIVGNYTISSTDV